MRRCDGLHDSVRFEWDAERTGGTLRDVVVSSVSAFALRHVVTIAVSGTVSWDTRSIRRW